MRFSTLPLASALAVGLLSIGAQANTNNNEPGSLLLFPIFKNSSSWLTQVTVTNTNPDSVAGSVRVEYVYINGYTCFETNITRLLTANDTLTVLTKADNPNNDEGYLYVFAKHLTSGAAIKFDWLIGTELVVRSEGELSYEVGPVVFKAASRIAAGGATDADGDGIRDLNGSEYEQAPDELLVPRFHGQVPGFVESELVLINLTGGSQFDALVDFLVYNDNEEVFSAQYEFRCWVRADFDEISGVFNNEFLLSTGDAVGETSGLTVDGNVKVETGWFRIDGNIASSFSTSILDPAILALRIESLSDEEEGVANSLDDVTSAALPFSRGSQANGDLVPHTVNGDSN